MSCADVCLDDDPDPNDFSHEETRTARKKHQCCECHNVIEPGTRYKYFVGKAEGELFIAKTCAICEEIRTAFYCGGWYFGMLWENIREVMFPIWQEQSPLDCLAKLESLEARDRMRASYLEWLGTSRAAKAGRGAGRGAAIDWRPLAS